MFIIIIVAIIIIIDIIIISTIIIISSSSSSSSHERIGLPGLNGGGLCEDSGCFCCLETLGIRPKQTRRLGMRVHSGKMEALKFLDLEILATQIPATLNGRIGVLVYGYGLRFPTEIYGNKREKTVFHESLQEASVVLTEISENLRRPQGVCGRTQSRNPVLQLPLSALASP